MKTSYNGSVITTDDEKMIGVNLGADYYAEHEFGIDGLKVTFGIPQKIDYAAEYQKSAAKHLVKKYIPPVFGINRRSITTCRSEAGDSIHFFSFTQDKKRCYALISGDYPKNFESISDVKAYYKSYLPYLSADNELACAWDENQFAVVAHVELKTLLKKLYDSFFKNDIAIYMSGGHVFKNAGLCVCVRSEIPEKYINLMRESDEAEYNVCMAAYSTGIYDILEKAGKTYYALVPNWTDDSKTKIHFFLNPIHQQKYNFGWFTVNELKDWANDCGPVVVKKKDNNA